jgi:hypothetical protein
MLQYVAFFVGFWFCQYAVVNAVDEDDVGVNDSFNVFMS